MILLRNVQDQRYTWYTIPFMIISYLNLSDPENTFPGQSKTQIKDDQAPTVDWE